MSTTDRTMSPTAAARAAEERGFESYWVPEHVHIPVERASAHPVFGTNYPDGLIRALDPIVALTAAATATTTIRLGTAVCLVSEHEPLALARAVASLDYLSGGRFLFGVGAGWLREELETLGTRYETRWQVTEQRVQAMKALWTNEEAEFHSEFVDFPRTLVYPKPVQRPHPPVYIGAASRWGIQRVVAWGDGWLPNIPDPGFIEAGMAEIHRQAVEADRDPASLPTTVFPADPERIADYVRLGVERCVFYLPSAGADAVLAELDRLADIVRAWTHD